MIIRLARQDVSIGFDTHAVQRGGASLDAEVVRGGIELAILCGRLPNEFLPALGCFARGDVEDGLKFTFIESGSNRQAVPRIDQRVEPDGGHAEVGEEIQRVWNLVNV